MAHTKDQAAAFVKQIDDLRREKNIGVGEAAKSLGGSVKSSSHIF